MVGTASLVEVDAGRRSPSRQEAGLKEPNGVGWLWFSPLQRMLWGRVLGWSPYLQMQNVAMAQKLWTRGAARITFLTSRLSPEVFFLSRDRSFHDHQRPLRVPSRRSCHTRECLCPGVKQAKENIDLGLGSGPVLSHHDLGLHICGN